LACLLLALPAAAAESESDRPDANLTPTELAEWIDAEFLKLWREAKVEPSAVVDDATFLRRAYLDLNGTIPNVSQARDFLDSTTPTRRADLVDRLLNDRRRPEKHADRTAANLAVTWRRMMVPGNTPEAQRAVAIEPWLKDQFLENVPYNELARRLITATGETAMAPAVADRGPIRGAGPGIYLQAIGGKPESAASSVSRVFLGVRIGCAECHDHPFADWKKQDFWGMAAFFSGLRNGALGDARSATIRPENGTVDYVATFLDGRKAEISAGRTPRETLVEWMVAADNPQFAATAVNRVWQHLLGRGMTNSVDDLDTASPAERRILDGLARRFVASGYNVRWLIAGICRSEVYQRDCIAVDESSSELPLGLRSLKTLGPEQVFNALEQALALPVARADGGARFNGLRDQLVSRFNEAASNSPQDYRAGIPQALLMMNGKLTADATDLDHSRTLRGVLEAPFLDREGKLTTLYLAAFARPPRDAEKKYLIEYLQQHPEADTQKQVFAEIFWSLLNSPEFVLER
jgi:hypothetical protein